MLGQDSITALDADESATAAAAVEVYEAEKDGLLGEFQWNFATKRVPLSLLTAAPPDPWTRQFSLPADFLLLLKTSQAGLHYDIQADDDSPHQLRLYTDVKALDIVYIASVGEGLFPPYFQDALVHRLASCLAMPITENPAIAQFWERKAMSSCSKAKALDYNQAPAREIVDDAGVSSRRFSSSGNSSSWDSW